MTCSAGFCLGYLLGVVFGIVRLRGFVEDMTKSSRLQPQDRLRFLARRSYLNFSVVGLLMACAFVLPPIDEYGALFGIFFIDVMIFVEQLFAPGAQAANT